MWSGDPVISGAVFKRMRRLPGHHCLLRVQGKPSSALFVGELGTLQCAFRAVFVVVAYLSPSTGTPLLLLVPLKEAWKTSRNGMEPPGKESKVKSY